MLTQSIHVFPNPASSRVDVTLEKGSGRASLKIMDVMGNEILYTGFSGPDLKIDVGQLANGIYFLLISNGNFQVLKKLVVNHY